ncbi:MAG: helix-turn-helix domain-containing protein [Pseudomonadota bacterium]
METLLTSRLSVLSHPQRMAVFRLLMRRYPDHLPAGEIAEALDTKPSTTSVYLSALTGAGLLDQRRAGTSLLYRINMEAAQAVVSDLFFDCCKGRPDLCPPFVAHIQGASDANGKAQGGAQEQRKYNVLFLCTGNSARSIFAESILRDVAGDRFNAFSAGTKPYSELNPQAVALLTEKGIETDTLRAKHMAEFRREDAPHMDFVFTVCDRAANEECPAWSGQPISAHWGQPDPVKIDAEQALAFQQAYGMLRNRITAFAALPFPSLDRLSLQNRVDAIGADKNAV